MGGFAPFNNKWSSVRPLGGVMYEHTVQNGMVQERGQRERERGREVSGFAPFNDTWSQ